MRLIQSSPPTAERGKIPAAGPHGESLSTVRNTMNESKDTRYLPVKEWSNHHPWPTEFALRHYIVGPAISPQPAPVLDPCSWAGSQIPRKLL